MEICIGIKFYACLVSVINWHKLLIGFERGISKITPPTESSPSSPPQVKFMITFCSTWDSVASSAMNINTNGHITETASTLMILCFMVSGWSLQRIKKKNRKAVTPLKKKLSTTTFHSEKCRTQYSLPKQHNQWPENQTWTLGFCFELSCWLWVYLVLCCIYGNCRTWCGEKSAQKITTLQTCNNVVPNWGRRSRGIASVNWFVIGAHLSQHSSYFLATHFVEKNMKWSGWPNQVSVHNFTDSQVQFNWQTSTALIYYCTYVHKTEMFQILQISWA